MAQAAIYVHGMQWASFDSLEEAIECRNAIATNNRWWKENRKTVEISADMHGEEAPPSDPYQRWWQCTWIPGRAGWDLVPITDIPYRGEHVNQNGRDAQSATLTAPTASLAQERAIFMLMEKRAT